MTNITRRRFRSINARRHRYHRPGADAEQRADGQRRARFSPQRKVMGPLPGDERCARRAGDEEVDCGRHVRRLITYASEPGSRTPAYLLIPKSALTGTPAPAALCLHGTNNTIGHAVVIEGSGRRRTGNTRASWRSAAS